MPSIMRAVAVWIAGIQALAVLACVILLLAACLPSSSSTLGDPPPSAQSDEMDPAARQDYVEDLIVAFDAVSFKNPGILTLNVRIETGELPSEKTIDVGLWAERPEVPDMDSEDYFTGVDVELRPFKSGSNSPITFSESTTVSNPSGTAYAVVDVGRIYTYADVDNNVAVLDWNFPSDLAVEVTKVSGSLTSITADYTLTNLGLVNPGSFDVQIIANYWNDDETPTITNYPTGLEPGASQSASITLNKGWYSGSIEVKVDPSDLIPEVVNSEKGNRDRYSWSNLQFSESFWDRDQWGTSTGSYTKSIDTTTYATKGNYGFSSNATSLSMNGGDGTHGKGIFYDFSSAVSPIYISFWIRNDVVSDSGYTAFSKGSTALMRVNFTTAGEISVNGSNFSGYSSRVWHHIELKNIDWTANTFDIFIGEVSKGTGIAFLNSAASLDIIDLYNITDTKAWWDEIILSQ